MLHKSNNTEQPLLKRVATLLHKRESTSEPKKSLITNVLTSGRSFYQHLSLGFQEVSQRPTPDHLLPLKCTDFTSP